MPRRAGPTPPGPASPGGASETVADRRDATLPDMNTAPALHPVARALWNLRWLGLFAIGPVTGVVLLDLVFGLPGQLIPLAGGGMLLMIFLFAFLFASEYRRLRDISQPPR